MSEVYLEKVTVRYPRVVALDQMTLTIHHGEFLALLGPSGCGKTTAIRVIGGFIAPDEGNVFVDQKRVEKLPPINGISGSSFRTTPCSRTKPSSAILPSACG